MNSFITNRVIDIVNICFTQVKFGTDSVDENLIGCGLDSIMLIIVIVALEEEFAINIPNEFHLIDEMSTITKIARVVEDVLSEEDR